MIWYTDVSASALEPLTDDQIEYLTDLSFSKSSSFTLDRRMAVFTVKTEADDRETAEAMAVGVVDVDLGYEVEAIQTLTEKEYDALMDSVLSD